MATVNLLSGLPATTDAEQVTALWRAGSTRVERIVSTGQASPPGFWYDQDEHEWVVLLQGAAGLSFDDGERIELGPGDSLAIPARRRHRVDWTSHEPPAVWLAVFAA